jgi:hypothetical protein
MEQPLDFAQGKPFEAGAQRLAPILWFLFTLFFLRVLGQVLVAFAGVTWLPPMRYWYSGLISYPYLLASQIVMLAGMSKINADFTRGDGWFARPNPARGRVTLWFGWLYLSSMILRYAITRTLLIPVTLHCVLAVYLILIGRYLRAVSPNEAEASYHQDKEGRLRPAPEGQRSPGRV